MTAPTPLVPFSDDGRDVFLKLELDNPTGSFKDRGAVLLAGAAADSGVELAVCDSSGNAGIAAAAAFAARGIALEVFVPESAAKQKRAAIESYGARLVLVPGTRTDVALAAAARVRGSGAFYASHVHQDVFLDGTAAIATEIVEQLDGVRPAVVITPVGNGSLLLGLARGFARVSRPLPILVGVQARACAPLAVAFETGATDPAPVVPALTVADGVAIATPPRGREILAAVRACGGRIVAVEDDETVSAQARLARAGIAAEPTGAVALAALARVQRSGGPEIVMVTGIDRTRKPSEFA